MKNQKHLLHCILTIVAFAVAGMTASGEIVLPNFSTNNPLKIMAVGDSITDDCSINGAWRLPLQPLLETNGFPFTFVGRQQTQTPPAGFTKRQHEGYCGAVVAAPGIFGAHQYSPGNNYLQKIVPEALTNATPDVMLIWIAANDIGNGRNPFVVATNHMNTLLNIIFSNAPNVNVVLTKATRQENSSGAIGTNIPIYNAALQGVVNQRRALGQKVYLADLYSVVTYPGNFYDGLHPNAAGLAQAATEWLARLQMITVRTDLVSTVFINGGANWRYNDTGQDLGPNWTQPAFDDSGWSNGIARLGYGDLATATTVNYGPQSNNKYVTTYFRHPFVAPQNGVISNLNLRVAKADGVVVWLNGQEIYRANLPSGPISYTNLASSAMTYYTRHNFNSADVPVSNLPAGTNWIAAEVHLSSVTASAMGFDMELIGTGSALLSGSLQLSVPSTAYETNGTLTGQGNVVVNVAPTNNLIVSLTSSDTSEATVPDSVVILAGHTNTTFDITIIADALVDSDQVVTLTASATNYLPAHASMTVRNTDQASLLYLSIPPAATEGDGTLVGQGSLNVTPTPTNDLAVSLTSSDTSEVTVPPTVIIPAGQSNAVFNLSVSDDALLDADQVATITATALNCSNAQAAITVHDNDTTILTVTLPASASEGDGAVANAGQVSVPIPVSANFTVALTSGTPSRLTVPATITIVSGQSSAMFDLTFVNNNVIEGSKNASVTAHVPSWTDGSSSMTILDDDPLPAHIAWSLVPSPQVIGEPFGVTLTAQDGDGNTVDFNLPVTFEGLTAGAATGTNTLLNTPSPSASAFDGETYGLGYSFTPGTNLTVTHVRHYFGDKVSIWTDAGSLVASKNVVSVPGTWVDTPLATPVVLTADTTYRLAAREVGVDYYWRMDLPGTFADGTINESWWGGGDEFPTQPDFTRWYFVDLKYAKGAGSIAVSPSLSGTFTHGIWSGQLAVLQAATNVMIQARAGAGHSGASVLFNVLGTPKLAIAAFSNSVVLSWPVAASGFNLEQASTLPNWSASSVTPVVVGDRYKATNSLGAARMFYRLRKP